MLNSGWDWGPNLAFTVSINGVVSQTMGTVLSRGIYPEDPWVNFLGTHDDGIVNGNMLWGGNGFGNGDTNNLRDTLKMEHGGINVYVSAIPEPSSFCLGAGGLTLLALAYRRNRS